MIDPYNAVLAYREANDCETVEDAVQALKRRRVRVWSSDSQRVVVGHAYLLGSIAWSPSLGWHRPAGGQRPTENQVISVLERALS